MVFPALSSLTTGIFAFIAFSFLTGSSQYLMLLLVGLCAPMFASAGGAVTQDVVQPGLRAMSYSIAQFCMMALGYSLSPLFIGAMSDRYDLLTAFQFTPIFSLIGAAAFFIGSFYYVRDLEKVAKVTLKADA